MRRLDALGVVEPSWAVFCLEIQNFAKPLEQFDVGRCVSAPSLRTMVAVRAGEGERAAGAFYEALGTRHFDAQQALDDPATVRGALEDAGLDAAWHDRAVSDPATWETVLDEHHAVCRETRSFGVPTIRLDAGTGAAIFGPVISNPPATDEDAVELWQHVSWLVRYQNFSELKRDRTIDPDLAYWRAAQARRAAERAAAAAS